LLRGGFYLVIAPSGTFCNVLASTAAKRRCVISVITLDARQGSDATGLAAHAYGDENDGVDHAIEHCNFSMKVSF
jgi:hypothetical protein